MENVYNLESYILPLDRVVKSDADEKIGTVLPLVRNSHDAVFVFGKNKFIGIVSPYKTLYKRRHPPKTKVKTCVFMPPHITIDTTINKVCEYMYESRVYLLPVFGNNLKEIIGVVRAKDILQSIVKDRELLSYVSKVIFLNQPITSHINSSVKDVYTLLRAKDISRVILVDNEGDLAGIVTRSDLREAFLSPKPRQRFSKKNKAGEIYAFDEEEKKRIDAPIKKYIKNMVFTISDNFKIEEVILKMVASQYNSIVVVDWRNRPTGFLSVRDLLKAIARVEDEKDIPIIMKKPSNNVDKSEIEKAKELLKKFGKKINKRIPIQKMEITFDEVKTPSKKTSTFNTTLIAKPVKGKSFIAKTKNKNFIKSIYETFGQIEDQERKWQDEKKKMHLK